MMISYIRPSASRAATSERYSGSTLSSSSCTGTTTEIATRRLEPPSATVRPVGSSADDECCIDAQYEGRPGDADTSTAPTSLRRVQAPSSPIVAADVERLNDRLALEHPIDDYYERSPFPIRFVEGRRLAIIRSFMGEVGGLDVAEVGSGGGHVLRMFPEAHLTAIDVSDEYLSIARRNLAGYQVRFVKGEIDKAELPAEGFDRVICTEVLEHVVDPDAVLGAIARMLRPAGVAVITVPNDPLIGRAKHIVRRSPARWILRDRIEWGGDTFHLHQWTPTAFAQLLGRYFTITDQGGAPFDHLPVRACFRCVRLSPARD